ncbi:MAG: hypothetical protein H7Y04_13570 [Verrucomicrobia bacterium]|nr:hypothetical protein [Cytophagales bacterium]
MKKTLFATLLVLLACVAFAQTAEETEDMGKTPEERAENQTQKLTKALTLTEAQVPKIKVIALANAQKVDEMRAKYIAQGNKRGMLSEYKNLVDATDAQYKEVFTVEQYTKFQEIKANRQQKMKDKKAERKASKKAEQ